jgi:hypothetical protein
VKNAQQGSFRGESSLGWNVRASVHPRYEPSSLPEVCPLKERS